MKQGPKDAKLTTWRKLSCEAWQLDSLAVEWHGGIWQQQMRMRARGTFLGGTWVSLSPVCNLLLVISFWSLSAAVHLALTSWHTTGNMSTQCEGRGGKKKEETMRGGRFRGWKGGKSERLKAVNFRRVSVIRPCEKINMHGVAKCSR